MANPYQSPQADSETVLAVPAGLECPWCGGRAMSWWRKANTAPFWRRECIHCGEGIQLPWRAFFRWCVLPSAAASTVAILTLVNFTAIENTIDRFGIAPSQRVLIVLGHAGVILVFGVAISIYGQQRVRFAKSKRTKRDR